MDCPRSIPMHPDRSGSLHRWRRSPRRHRGVSEVIGTILILSIAMVLISAVFLLVLGTPAPTVTPVTTFSVTLGRTSSTLVNVSIQYLVGPVLYGATTNLAGVQLTSATHPGTLSTIFPLSAGHLASSSQWTPGETWWLNVSGYDLPASDNLTVKVYQSGNLLFDQVVPGPNVLVAPYFTSVWTNPVTLVHGATYTIYATIVIPDGLGSGSVVANASRANGPLTPQAMTQGSTSGVTYWSYSPSTVPSSAGTYVVLLSVTDSQGLTSHYAESLTFT